ncbi:MAG: LPS export ABC transporter permease LptG [Proteobacteria bacterium]|nr:LPS export ABC transporter permease LptG [Pseudomonadota bacterium]
MSIIHKYLTLEIARYFGIVLGMVVGIYIAVDFFERIDDFIEAQLPISKALTYFIFKIPFIIAQIIPVCILLAVLIIFGLMNRNNEIVALKSSGVHIYYLLKPVLVIGLISSLFLFLFSEIVVPIAAEKANKIWLEEVRKESTLISKEKNIWIKGNRSIIHIKYYNPKAKAIFGITLNQFDKNFRLARRVDAQEGIFKADRWVLSNVIEQNLDIKDGGYRTTFYDSKTEALEFLPDDLKRVIKKSEAMSFKELLAYIQRIEKEGYDAKIYRVDLYAKTAFPLVCIIMCIMATGIAFRGSTREGLPLSIVYGIGVAFLYWIFLSFCISLGYGEMLPPFIAAWTANLVFLCVGVLTLLHAE